MLTVLRCLLVEPNPESALNEEAGKLLLEDYDAYYQRAKLMTSIQAMPKARAVASSPTKEAPKEAPKKVEKKKSLKRL